MTLAGPSSSGNNSTLVPVYPRPSSIKHSTKHRLSVTHNSSSFSTTFSGIPENIHGNENLGKVRRTSSSFNYKSQRPRLTQHLSFKQFNAHHEQLRRQVSDSNKLRTLSAANNNHNNSNLRNDSTESNDSEVDIESSENRLFFINHQDLSIHSDSERAEAEPINHVQVKFCWVVEENKDKKKPFSDEWWIDPFTGEKVIGNVWRQRILVVTAYAFYLFSFKSHEGMSVARELGLECDDQYLLKECADLVAFIPLEDVSAITLYSNKLNKFEQIIHILQTKVVGKYSTLLRCDSHENLRLLLGKLNKIKLSHSRALMLLGTGLLDYTLFPLTALSSGDFCPLQQMSLKPLFIECHCSCEERLFQTITFPSWDHSYEIQLVNDDDLLKVGFMLIGLKKYEVHVPVPDLKRGVIEGSHGIWTLGSCKTNCISTENAEVRSQDSATGTSRSSSSDEHPLDPGEKTNETCSSVKRKAISPKNPNFNRISNCELVPALAIKIRVIQLPSTEIEEQRIFWGFVKRYIPGEMTDVVRRNHDIVPFVVAAFLVALIALVPSSLFAKETVLFGTSIGLIVYTLSRAFGLYLEKKEAKRRSLEGLHFCLTLVDAALVLDDVVDNPIKNENIIATEADTPRFNINLRKTAQGIQEALLRRNHAESEILPSKTPFTHFLNNREEDSDSVASDRVISSEGSPHLRSRGVSIPIFESRKFEDLKYSAGTQELIDALAPRAQVNFALENLPKRWLDATKGHKDEALKRWKMCLEWRRNSKTDELLRRPHPNFSTIKSIYSHCFLGQDNGGSLVTIDDLSNTKEMFHDLKANGITAELLGEHNAFVMEYWIRNDLAKTGKLVKILDIKGLSIFSFNNNVTSYLGYLAGVYKSYPECLEAAYLVNAPTSFRVVWRVLSTFIDKNSLDKFHVLSGDVEKLKEILGKRMDLGMVPKAYGGTLDVDPKDYSLLPLEKELATYIHKLNSEYQAGEGEVRDMALQSDFDVTELLPIISGEFLVENRAGGIKKSELVRKLSWFGFGMLSVQRFFHSGVVSHSMFPESTKRIRMTTRVGYFTKTAHADITADYGKHFKLRLTTKFTAFPSATPSFLADRCSPTCLVVEKRVGFSGKREFMFHIPITGSNVEKLILFSDTLEPDIYNCTVVITRRV